MTSLGAFDQHLGCVGCVFSPSYVVLVANREIGFRVAVGIFSIGKLCCMIVFVICFRESSQSHLSYEDGKRAELLESSMTRYDGIDVEGTSVESCL
jgi:hypothetical protein